MASRGFAFVGSFRLEFDQSWTRVDENNGEEAAKRKIQLMRKLEDLLEEKREGDDMGESINQQQALE